MPELPEVESVRRSLEPHLIGALIERAVLRRADICEAFDEGAARVTPLSRHLLEGATVRGIQRLGKQLAVIADDGRVLCIHLGMTGQVLALRDEAAAAELSHVHAMWETRVARRMALIAFRDPRRFGGLWTFPSVELLKATRWNALGPDALEADGPLLHRAASGSDRPIKALLLDQSVLAGVGNIYADEALFEARIPPTAPSRRLNGAACDRLAAAVRAVLTRAIKAGGSTLRDYRNADGGSGNAVAGHAVYGRAGEPCVVCGGALVSGVIAQRTTVWCRHCQRAANTKGIPQISAASGLTYPHQRVEVG